MSADDIANPIVAITANEQVLMLGRESGEVLRFTIPHLTMESRYEFRAVAQRLEINCSSNKLAIIDLNGVLTLLDLETTESSDRMGSGRVLKVEFPSTSGAQRETRDPLVWDFRYEYFYR